MLLASIRFRLAASIGVLLVLLLAVSWTFRESFGRFDRAAQEARAARDAARECRELSRTLVDAESGQRGYVITGREEYLRSYREAVRRSDTDRADVRAALTRNATLSGRNDALDRLVVRKLDELAVTISVRRAEGTLAAVKLVDADEGRVLMDDIRVELDGIMAQLDVEASGIEKTLIVEREKFDRVLWFTAFGSILVFFGVGVVLSRSITGPLGELGMAARRIGEGRFDERISIRRDDELNALGRAFNDMASQLAAARDISVEQDWIQDELAKISVWMQESANLQELGEKVLSPLVRTAGAAQGSLYVRAHEEDSDALERRWAFTEGAALPTRIVLGEGLVGAVARDGKPLVHEGEDLGIVVSGTGTLTLRSVVLVAARFENETFGVLEVAATTVIPHRVHELLRRVAEPLGLVLRAFRTQEALRRALSAAQILSEELTRHTNELVARGRQLEEANVILEEQRTELTHSETLLRRQQHELFTLNEELEEKAQLLTDQNADYERKNRELELARIELASKADQLEKVSRVKSEFLANVSHELRTPLNSQLILSKILVENKDGNLSEKQIDYLRTIYTAGIDLLRLIDDVLDLSKIEAGRLDVNLARLPLATVAAGLEGTFGAVARERNLTFRVEIAGEGDIVTDGIRLRQILVNLVGNALKFTHDGSIVVRLGIEGDDFVATVEDTGIGIPAPQQEWIFEPFRQGDGSTSRAYGGSGLGLSISRQLATLLGGTIALERSHAGVGRDEEGRLIHGSVFSLRIPAGVRGKESEMRNNEERSSRPRLLDISQVRLGAGAAPARPVAADAAGRHLFEWSLAGTLVPARRTAPDSEPGRGRAPELTPGPLWLGALSEDPHSRVSRGSTVLLVDAPAGAVAALGAAAKRVGYLLTPVTREALERRFSTSKDAPSSRSLAESISSAPASETNVAKESTSSLSNALEGVRALIFFGAAPIRSLPVSVHLAPDGEAAAIAEACLFLQRLAQLPEDVVLAPGTDPRLAGRHVLVVDDDIRNVFALTALLERHGLRVAFSESGDGALELLREGPSPDAILLDMMMPKRDGFSTLEELRADPRFRTVPVIAVTAAAMPGDRERCLAAGASDYVTKPVDVDRLVALLKVWLLKQDNTFDDLP